jgi:hypothetical protein
MRVRWVPSAHSTYLDQALLGQQRHDGAQLRVHDALEERRECEDAFHHLLLVNAPLVHKCPDSFLLHRGNMPDQSCTVARGTSSSIGGCNIRGVDAGYLARTPDDSNSASRQPRRRLFQYSHRRRPHLCIKMTSGANHFIGPLGGQNPWPADSCPARRPVHSRRWASTYTGIQGRVHAMPCTPPGSSRSGTTSMTLSGSSRSTFSSSCFSTSRAASGVCRCA